MITVVKLIILWSTHYSCINIPIEEDGLHPALMRRLMLRADQKQVEQFMGIFTIPGINGIGEIGDLSYLNLGPMKRVGYRFNFSDRKVSSVELLIRTSKGWKIVVRVSLNTLPKLRIRPVNPMLGASKRSLFSGQSNSFRCYLLFLQELFRCACFVADIILSAFPMADPRLPGGLDR